MFYAHMADVTYEVVAGVGGQARWPRDSNSDVLHWRDDFTWTDGFKQSKCVDESLRVSPERWINTERWTSDVSRIVIRWRLLDAFKTADLATIPDDVQEAFVAFMIASEVTLAYGYADTVLRITHKH